MTSKMRPATIGLGLAVLLASFVLSCGTTSMKSAWRDETFQTTPKKIMVIALAKNPGMRRYYEDEFVNVLKKRGVDGIPSYMHFESRVDSATAIRKIRELGADAVLITRLLDQKTVETYYPPSVTYMGPSYYPSYYGGWYGYYGASYDYVSTPGYTSVEDIYSLETNVYDLNSLKLIYSGLSETGITSGASDSVVKEVVQVVSESMAEKKVIP
jgi:hypothetical protein